MLIGLFDTIKGAVGGALGWPSAVQLSDLISGLEGLLKQLQTSGYVRSSRWDGHEPNDLIDTPPTCVPR